MHQLRISSHQALDSSWFELILPHVGELYITLGILHNQLRDLRDQFESSPFNPDLRPLALDPALYRQHNKKLNDLRSNIKRTESSSMIREAYVAKIDELIIQNDLVLAAIGGDSSEVMRCNRWLYGTADHRALAGVCAWIRQQASQAYASSSPYISQAAATVLESVPDLQGSIHHIIPDDQTFKQVRESHFRAGGYIDALFGDAQIPDMVTPAIGDELTRTAIDAIGSTYSLQESTDDLWGVIHQQQAVVRPAGYSLKREEFIGIVSHEVGSHLLERENGLRQPLRLLSAGLDRYESSNEGRAFLREQIVYASPYDMLGEPAWEHIVLLYISSALAAGSHLAPYDFVTLYNTILPICQLFKAVRMPDNPVVAGLRASDEAWAICTRAAKGTNGHGGGFSKGLVYLSGNLAAWRLAASDPQIIFFGDGGKFDISRQDHRRILAACGSTLPTIA